MSLVADLRVVLDGFELAVAFEVAAGEVVALLGPNGAGKTTALRTVAGLRPLDAGRVVLAGRLLEDVERGLRTGPAARGIGVVFQDHLLLPHLDARDNVAFGLRARGLAPRAARAEATTWLQRLGVAEVARARPARLSGGQAQRVALARALATRPGLLLLDEPLAALDVDTRTRVRAELREHLRDFDGPVVLVTHDPVEALTLADRLVVVEDGRVVQSGAVTEVARRPRSVWAARFVGVNLLRGVARGTHVEVTPEPRAASSDGRPGDGRPADGRPGDGRPADGRPADGRFTVAEAHHGPVELLFHPRAVALHRDPPVAASPRNCWRAEITGLDVEGGRVRVQLAGPFAAVAEVTPAAVAELDLDVGRQVHATVKAVDIEVHPE